MHAVNLKVAWLLTLAGCLSLGHLTAAAAAAAWPQFRGPGAAGVDSTRALPTRWDLEERYPRELFQEAAALGWLGLALPEEYGGSGGGATLFALLCAELTRGSAAIALGLYMHTALAASAILHLGTPEQKARHLPAALAGRRIVC